MSRVLCKGGKGIIRRWSHTGRPGISIFVSIRRKDISDVGANGYSGRSACHCDGSSDLYNSKMPGLLALTLNGEAIAILPSVELVDFEPSSPPFTSSPTQRYPVQTGDVFAATYRARQCHLPYGEIMLVFLASFCFVRVCSCVEEEVGQDVEQDVARRISGGRPVTIIRVWHPMIAQADPRYRNSCPTMCTGKCAIAGGCLRLDSAQ